MGRHFLVYVKRRTRGRVTRAIRVTTSPDSQDAEDAIRYVRRDYPAARWSIEGVEEDARCEVCGLPMSAQEYRAGFRRHDRCEDPVPPERRPGWDPITRTYFPT